MTIAGDSIHCIDIYVINFKSANHFTLKRVVVLNDTLRRRSLKVNELVQCNGLAREFLLKQCFHASNSTENIIRTAQILPEM